MKWAPDAVPSIPFSPPSKVSGKSPGNFFEKFPIDPQIYEAANAFILGIIQGDMYFSIFLWIFGENVRFIVYFFQRIFNFTRSFSKYLQIFSLRYQYTIFTTHTFQVYYHRSWKYSAILGIYQYWFLQTKIHFRRQIRVNQYKLCWIFSHQMKYWKY